MKSIFRIALATFLLTGCAQDTREADEEAIRQADIASNKALVRHQLTEMDAGNLDVLDDVCGPDYKYHAMGVAEPLTCEEHKESARDFYQAFSDFGHTVDDIFASGDRVVTRLTDFGTHTGTFLGIPATGRRVAWSVTVINRIENGKIAEVWLDADLPSLFQQLGATPQGWGVPTPKEIIDLGALVTEDLPQRVWGKALMESFNFDRPNSFDVIHWDFADGQVSGTNAYYTLFNHGGPHVDAPNHMGFDGGVDSYPIEAFSGPLKVFDVSAFPLGRTVPVDVFQGHDIQPGDVVLIYTAYTPPQNDVDFPETIAPTPEAAEYLAQIPVRAFGTDALAVANLQAGPVQADTAVGRVMPNHTAFLSRSIPIYEQLFNVDRLLGKENMYFTGAPLNIKDGDGMIVRPLVFVY